jgi:hypothetical protein
MEREGGVMSAYVTLYVPTEEVATFRAVLEKYGNGVQFMSRKTHRNPDQTPFTVEGEELSEVLVELPTNNVDFLFYLGVHSGREMNRRQNLKLGLMDIPAAEELALYVLRETGGDMNFNELDKKAAAALLTAWLRLKVDNLEDKTKNP